MTSGEKIWVGFLILLIIIQIGVIGCLVYSKYEKPANNDIIVSDVKKETNEHDELINKINLDNNALIKIQYTHTNENNETVTNEKELTKDTLNQVIQKLKENTSNEELKEGIESIIPVYSYIVKYKENENNKEFKVIITNDTNKAWVTIDDKTKLYNFNDNINDFMKTIYG